ncbi:LytR/AlgR family response regulator transcription factor [Maricaulis maris]|uniref:LytTr DNA-binding domain-containing protein n=1 Tax=Maricaulis maris TaxID=74318 RepID=A0A495D274_9PROT|nr:LytTR family DNA-binding domain-containing protein [Maricaulis maris]RKQ95646.1 LytTr DNA-binding domain-containing protein [Maricaulis maris]
MVPEYFHPATRIPRRWMMRILAGASVFWGLHVLAFVAIQYGEAVAAGAPPSFALGVRHQSVFSAIVLPAIVSGALLGLDHALRARHVVRRIIESIGLVAVFAIADYFWTVLVLAPYTGVPPQILVGSTPSLYWLLLPSFTVMAYLAGAQLRAIVGRGEQRAADGSSPGRLAVKSSGRTDYVTLADIVVVSAQGNYVSLIDRSGREVLHRATMIEMAQVLEGHGFIQIHRSHFVRPSEVVSAEQRGDRISAVRLKSGSVLPVSATGSAILAQALAGPRLVSSA